VRRKVYAGARGGAPRLAGRGEHDGDGLGQRRLVGKVRVQVDRAQKACLCGMCLHAAPRSRQEGPCGQRQGGREARRTWIHPSVRRLWSFWYAKMSSSCVALHVSDVPVCRGSNRSVTTRTPLACAAFPRGQHAHRHAHKEVEKDARTDQVAAENAARLNVAARVAGCQSLKRADQRGRHQHRAQRLGPAQLAYERQMHTRTCGRSVKSALGRASWRHGPSTRDDGLVGIWGTTACICSGLGGNNGTAAAAAATGRAGE
jgi:hypothetical protein